MLEVKKSMYLRFTKIIIEGFQSIKEVELELDNQGIVFIKGVNEYDEYTDSNGSGKSSIFEAINWAIFGKTTKGVSKVKNRYLDTGCSVQLFFNIDSVNYEIGRSIDHERHGSSLYVIQDDKDISGRNKTDTEKIIQNSIMSEFSQDIFLSIVFLSQGFNNRLSTLSPSGRKDRLETLSQISSKIDSFKSELSSVKSDYSDSILKLSQDISKNTGEKSSCEKELFRLEQIINEAQSTSKPDINLEETQSKINHLKETLNSLQELLNSKQDIRSEINLHNSSLSTNKNSIINEMDRYKKLLVPACSKTCPTCNQPLGLELSSKLIKEYKQKISECKNNIVLIDNKLKESDSSLKSINDEINLVLNKINYMNNKISEMSTLVIEYLKVKDVSSEQSHVKELKSQIHDFDVDINKYEQEKSNINDLKKVVEHCEGLVSKQFRNYLLEDIIKFINSRLLIYSKMLYSNEEDIIYLKSDSSKLDIYLGDSIYDSLSGGEGRKVDLALSLAQRDLALNISGSSSNLLILDEIMDNLDDKAINSVTSMFTSVADDIDSMFIISHKPPLNIPYDSIITIVKGNDKISEIMRS